MPVESTVNLELLLFTVHLTPSAGRLITLILRPGSFHTKEVFMKLGGDLSSAVP